MDVLFVVWEIFCVFVLLLYAVIDGVVPSDIGMGFYFFDIEGKIGIFVLEEDEMAEYSFYIGFGVIVFWICGEVEVLECC